jgi:4-amino-4-deoxychorismate lyase
LSTWINGRSASGRAGSGIDPRDRGLQYGDGLFETMRVRNGGVRLLEYHLDRFYAGCRSLKLAGPARGALSRELARIGGQRRQGILKLILTRGAGQRGYRPTGQEQCTRVITLDALPSGMLAAEAGRARVRLCATRVGANPSIAGLKTLNRLESVLARSEWRDARIWEGVMCDVDGYVVCGTMSNIFLRRGSLLVTPILDRCGVAGVMRRWILERAAELQLRTAQRRVRWSDLAAAEEVFMCNAVVGMKSVRAIERPPARGGAADAAGGADRLAYTCFTTAQRLRALLACV